MRTTTFALAALLLAALLPAVSRADDQAMAQDIADHIRGSGRLKNYSIGVKFEEGTAWLSGRVANQQQMSAALQLAKQAPTVSRVVNQLEIGSDDEAAPAGQMLRQPPPMDYADMPVRQASAQFAGAPEPSMSRMPVRHAAPQRGAQGRQGRPIPVGYVAGMGQPPCADGSGGMGAPGAMGVPPEMMQGMQGMQGMPADMSAGGGPLPAYVPGTGGGVAPAVYDQPNMPNYAWPSYSAYPNYAALTYPRQYSPTAWPFIGPFYPYPQVPLGWRKVTLEWDDGWWFLDFHNTCK